MVNLFNKTKVIEKNFLTNESFIQTKEESQKIISLAEKRLGKNVKPALKDLEQEFRKLLGDDL
jgi:hypothetical protein